MADQQLAQELDPHVAEVREDLDALEAKAPEATPVEHLLVVVHRAVTEAVADFPQAQLGRIIDAKR